MKDLYLLYSGTLNTYFFGEGHRAYDSRRREEFSGELSPNELVKKVDSLLDKKRKSKLHLVDVPKDAKKLLENLLKSTKIEIC